ncbi:hypothetical protein KC953_01870, partial [Candidatus Saccharibacteria bacterium]|nr:hypothetical protein [Candidatus Saccharibacteria bacterium]
MEMIMVIVLAVVVFGMGAIIFMLLQRMRDSQGGGSVDLIKADVTELNRSIMKLQESMGDKLERNNDSIQKSVQKQLSESAKLVADVTERLTKLDETN